MKTLKRLSKKAVEFCEMSGYDVERVKELMNSNSFAIERLETKKEMDEEGCDYAYPYKIFDPFHLL